MRGSWSSDRDPLLALARGDTAPFEDFVRLESATLLGFFRRLGAAPDECEDLLQDVLLKLVRHAPRYRGEERFEAFCFRVARNAWIDRGRRLGTRPADSLEDQGAEVDAAAGGREVPAPGEALEARDDAERLLADVARLPEGQRAVFELAVVQELPYADVGAALGIPVGTVKSRMHHAVHRLRELAAEREREESVR